MSDAIRNLERAANWQAERRQQAWTEKVRQVERVLPDLRAWRRIREQPTPDSRPLRET